MPLTAEPSHTDRQAAHFEATYAGGHRQHVVSTDPLVRYLITWRLHEAVTRLERHVGPVSRDASVLFLCAGEGAEGSTMADMGFTNITVSDLAQSGADAAMARDPRLKAIALDAERSDLPDASYDLVVVQDGLHHLQRPVAGFTEMLRIARTAAFFLEPHDSLAGRRIGMDWEEHDDAVNYVFRWTTRLVEEVASSYLGRDAFDNLSFSFWHHNVVLDRLGQKLGGGDRGLKMVKALKRTADAIASGQGNQFCGMVVKRRTAS